MSSAPKSIAIETRHDGLIHDAQLDYYGKRLATASSDCVIKIFDVSKNSNTTTNTNTNPLLLMAELRGHEGPVWQLCWSHPKFNSLLASCSYDKKIVIWRQLESDANNPSQFNTSQSGTFIKVYEYNSHTSSVNSIAFAPHLYGLILAAGSADGNISIHRFIEGRWDVKVIENAHQSGVNCIAFSPTIPNSNNTFCRLRLASGGCDNKIKIWALQEDTVNNTSKWVEEKCFDSTDANPHSDWIRDIAWCNSSERTVLAACSEDKNVSIWIEGANGMMKKSKVLTFETKPWRVSFSSLGNILAVAVGDGKVSLFKQTGDGWKSISTLDE